MCYDFPSTTKTKFRMHFSTESMCILTYQLFQNKDLFSEWMVFESFSLLNALVENGWADVNYFRRRISSIWRYFEFGCVRVAYMCLCASSLNANEMRHSQRLADTKLCMCLCVLMYDSVCVCMSLLWIIYFWVGCWIYSRSSTTTLILVALPVCVRVNVNLYFAYGWTELVWAIYIIASLPTKSV